MPTRRQVLLQSTLGVYFLIDTRPSLAQALAPDQQGDFREVFRADPLGNPEVDLNFLLERQENSQAVPEDEEGFKEYINENQIITNLRAQDINPVLYHYMIWHNFALDLTSKDHTVIEGENDPTYSEQIGPCRTSWALAIVHLAKFEAINAILRIYQSYKGIQEQIYADTGLDGTAVNASNASLRTAIAYAAYEALIALYPNKKPLTDAQLKTLLPIMGDDNDAMRQVGKTIGSSAASAVLAARGYDQLRGEFEDGSLTGHDHPEPDFDELPSYQGPDYPDFARWQIDPISQIQTALGGRWPEVEPFVLTSPDQFRPAGPDINSNDFQAQVDEVRRLGGDPNASATLPRSPTLTDRTGQSAQGQTVDPPFDRTNPTFVGIFWGYDGTALLCAPPRLYNMIATSYALRERPITDVAEMARYLALVNIAMADAGIAAWDAKFHFRLARPVTYLRNRTPSSVAGGIVDTLWTPLGAPVTNGRQPNLTPPFPTYVSGHATFGAALFQTMRRVFNTLPDDSDTTFQFISDEYNGVNRGPNGEHRPRVLAEFAKFSDAEEDNARSRIYLGIHWQVDATDGIALGRQVADQVFSNILQSV